MNHAIATVPQPLSRTGAGLLTRSFGPWAMAMLLLLAVRGHSAPVTEAWVQRYGFDGGSSSDEARKVVTDTAGNVFVVGSSSDGITGQDILVIKYSGAGLPLWTNRYNGPSNDDDWATAAVVDGSGNLFVTGYSFTYRTGGVSDFVTIAYSGAGQRLWTNHYRGPGSGFDIANAVAVDGGGNVFVTGRSRDLGRNFDFATVAYSGSGVPLWTNRYNGPGDAMDEAKAVAVDAQGNVFVTGFVGQADQRTDCLTIAYTGAGLPLWTNRYSGPGNDDDYGEALAVDASGNVFVTGQSWVYENLVYLTIAYSGAGVPLWTNHYNSGISFNRATAVAVNGNGNVFVTGTSHDAFGNSAFSTIAYSGAGTPLWTNRYQGPQYGIQEAYALAVDASGHVFVTGRSEGDFITIAYSGAGLPLWTNRSNGFGSESADMAVDGSGNVFVTGGLDGGISRDDFVTIAYSGAGVPRWTNRYDGPGQSQSQDSARALAVDGSGNVFVTGQSEGRGSAGDYATIAYSAGGVPLWTNRYNGEGNLPDAANAVAVNGSGNVFVTGYSYRNNTNSDFVTIAYSGAGAPLWTNRYHGPGEGRNEAIAMAVNPGGNVFVTGHATGGDGSKDYATIAYSGAGVGLWTNLYGGPGEDYPTAMVADRSGKVVVTGISFGVGTEYDFATIAYSGEGVPLWTNRFNGPANYRDVATGVAVDGSGNVFVTGYSTSLTQDSADYLTIAYSGAGVPLWTNRYDGPDHGSDGAAAVAVDGQGNVFVTGTSHKPDDGESQIATIAYSGQGVPLWTNRYDGPNGSYDSARAVVVDAGGNVFVTGSLGEGSDGGFDFVTIAYSGAGLPLWTNRFDGPANGDEFPQAMCLATGPDGAVYVTGSSDGDYSGNDIQTDYVTVKYVWRSAITIQPLAAGSPNVDLSLSAAPGSSWSVQRALAMAGPWTRLGTVQIGPDGAGQFRDPNPPAIGAFYRAVQP